MTVDHDADIRRITRCLSEIAQTLDSMDDANERVQRTLLLTHDLVPYQSCALLKAPAESEPELFTVPPLSLRDRETVRTTLMRVLKLVVGGEDQPQGLLPSVEAQITLPITGLDQVIGVIRVEPRAGVTYEARHLRLLSVVAAQLGGYFALIRLRDEEAQRTKQLAEAHDFQQILVGVVSHDLRNPLSVITTIASTLLKKTQDQRQAQAIERALRSAQKANRIINDLLDVTDARVKGRMSVNKKRVELRALLTDVIEDVRIAHPGRAIELRLPASDPAASELDADRLNQAVTNLINNALQYGDPASAVTVELRLHDDDAEISVRNRGEPIPESLLPVIFDPFRQGAKRRHRVAGGGLGLGLYIVDQVARAHGGEAHVVSNAAQGTTFTLILPRWSRAEGSENLGPAAAPKVGALVMVVDDDADVRGGIVEILQAQGYRVASAANGADALAQLRSGLRPTLILLDLWMPIMDGEQFHNICQQDQELSSIPVFIISADAATAIKLTHFGATGYLPKPLQLEQLLSTVQTAAT